jgi:uncharacterized membrane protein YdjX (TVP38/TMEM64 family)
MNRKKKFTLFVAFLLFCLFIAILSGYFGFNLPSLEKVVASHYLISLLIYTLLFIFLTTISFSASAVILAGVLFFSIPIVSICAMIGIMGGAIIHYIIAEKLGKEYVRNYLEKKGGKLEKFDEILEKNNFKTITILSAAFIVPPPIPNFLGGVMKINLRDFSIATFIGNLPNAIFLVYLTKGILYSNKTQIYISIIGIALVTIIALYFYKGELKSILRLSFPWMFRKNKLKN